jgi:hypothetical protein
MIELKLKRKRHSDKQVIGVMNVYKDNLFVFSLATLELCWDNNRTTESCILPDFYIVEHYSSNKYPNAFILKDVKGRTLILIHNGNYYTNTEGCILVGLTHKDINADGYIDVSQSKTALNKLIALCDGEETISIKIT